MENVRSISHLREYIDEYSLLRSIPILRFTVSLSGLMPPYYSCRSLNRVDSLCVEGQQDQSIDTPNLFMSLHFRESLNRNDTKAK